MILTLFDETGLQLLPPGILVTLSTPVEPNTVNAYLDEANIDELVFDNATTGGVVASGYTEPLGQLKIPDGLLVPGTVYTVTFAGSLGPQSSIVFTFTEGQSTLTVTGYVVPEFCLDADGFVAAASAIGPLPTWFVDAPIATSFLKGYAAVQEALGAELQECLAALRPQTSQGSDLDSLVADFFGIYLPRRLNELDSSYEPRFVANFAQRSTYQDIVNAVLDFFENDQTDGAASHDVFDWMSDPVRAAYYDLDGDAAEFAVISYFPPVSNLTSWYIGHFLGQGTYLSDPWAFSKSTTPPFPLLGQRIEQHRGKGTRPVYISSPGEIPQ